MKLLFKIPTLKRGQGEPPQAVLLLRSILRVYTNHLSLALT